MTKVDSSVSSLVTFHALHKGGSSALVRVMGQLCALRGLSVYSHNLWHGTKDAKPSWHGGITPDVDSLMVPGLDHLLSSVNPARLVDSVPERMAACVGVVRNFEEIEGANVLSFFILRNPLDMLVSAYFSFGFTHNGINEKIASMDINEYVLKDEVYGATALKLRFRSALDKYNAQDRGAYGKRFVFMSYAELVLSQETFLYHMASQMGFSRPEFVANIISKRNERFVKLPEELQSKKREHPTHLRAIIPGNYIVHLNNQTIVTLQSLFSEELSMLHEVEGELRFDAFYDQPTHPMSARDFMTKLHPSNSKGRV